MSHLASKPRRRYPKINAVCGLMVALVSACTELKRGPSSSDPMAEAASSDSDAGPTPAGPAAAAVAGAEADGDPAAPDMGTDTNPGPVSPVTDDASDGDSASMTAMDPGGDPGPAGDDPSCDAAAGEDCAPASAAGACATPPCATCPQGLSADAAGGCLPILTGLALSHGTLVPALSPTVTEYSVELPLALDSDWTLTPSVAAGVRIEFNGEAGAADVPAPMDAPLFDETLLVINLAHDQYGTRSYRVRVVRAGRQRLVATTPPATAHGLGTGIAATDTWAVVGAPRAPDASAAEAGAAFVFEDDGEKLVQRARLTPSQPVRAGHFGQRVAIEGQRIAVGAPGEGAGAVYVFDRVGADWQESARLVPTGGASQAAFGRSLTLRGDVLIIGAPDDNERLIQGAGAAYVFVRSASGFSQSQRLTSPEPQLLGWFASSVTFDGQTLVIGATGESPMSTASGAAYVYTFSGGQFSAPKRIVPANSGAADLFGDPAVVEGDTLVLSSVGASSGAVAAGAVYVFQRDTNGWTQRAQLAASNPTTGAVFGASLALRGHAVLVGATLESSAGRGIGRDAASGVLEASGAAYLFVRSKDGFSRPAILKAEQPEAGAYYGSAVALMGNTLLVGVEGGEPAESALYEVR